MTVSINLDGKPKEGGESVFERIHVNDDVHDGKFKEVIVVDGVNFDSGNPEKKIVVNVELQEGIVSAWYTPKVTKGSGTYSSSNLYILLEKSNLLEDFKPFSETITTEEQLGNWFSEKLSGKGVKVLTKSITSKKDGVVYSKIDKIISLA